MEQRAHLLKKPYSNAVLKTLPPERQREIYAYLQAHKLRETKAWLALAGVKTSVTALSYFYRWYPAGASLHAAGQVRGIVQELLQASPALAGAEPQLCQAAQDIFAAHALHLRAPKLFLGLRQLQQRNRAAELEAARTSPGADRNVSALFVVQARIARLEAKNAEAVKTLQCPALSAPEKIARIRVIFELERF